jgi:hypothetical protein
VPLGSIDALGAATFQRAAFNAPSRAVFLATVLTVATARCGNDALQSSSPSRNLGDGGDSGVQQSEADGSDSSAAVHADGQADTAGQPDATAAADGQMRAPNDAGSAEVAVPALRRRVSTRKHGPNDRSPRSPRALRPEGYENSKTTGRHLEASTLGRFKKRLGDEKKSLFLE